MFWNESGAPLPRVSNLRRRKGPKLPISSWLYASDTSGRSNHQFPYLMLTEEMRKGFLKFVSLSDGSIQSVSLPSVFHGARCVGSCLGWLFMVPKPKKKAMIENFLFNPFLKAIVKLPSLSSKEYMGFRGFCLSSAPNSDEDCIVAIIPDSGYLAFCRPGDASWTMLGGCFGIVRGFVYSDIVFHKGKLNGVGFTGKLVVINGERRRMVDMIPHCVTKPLGIYVRQYLVECDDELLMVSRFLKFEPKNRLSVLPCPLRTVYFKVYKYCDVTSKWKKIKSLGDKMIFLGITNSKCYSTIEFPGFIRDSIYFNHDNYERMEMDDKQLPPFNDLGVYKLRKRRVEPCAHVSLTLLNFRSLWHEPSFAK